MLFGADERADAIADEDQAIVPVIEPGAKHVFDNGGKHHQQTAKGKAHQADAEDEVRQAFGHRQHLKIKKMTDISQTQAGFKAKIPLCL